MSRPFVFLLRLALVALVLAFLFVPEAFRPLLEPFAPVGAPAIYDRASLLDLTISHLLIVVAAIVPATLISVALAILVSRPIGAEFLPLSRAIVNIGQTFPPVAVLALAVPVVGFGTWPTLIALFLYGLLPIFENTLAGLTGLQPAVAEAAKGTGMTGRQRLFQVELPLALPVILEGVRISLVIALSTATIGSTVAAKGLGEVIIAGLNSNNLAFVLQGGLLTGALAVILYDGLGEISRMTAARS
ncbi:ABC transporter permease [Afifella marina]|uniref:Osmoprotectant transport system permease protein n=1 Tax=Afifella marina DSM 2698 TaxID=1120955 RepID=A0A1G5M7I3_AFIMA|nr:ABC transporter permease [Afifella marina]MBK1622865.1 ABC transporter [Afifella marina DSM 2698]MBK1625860.1 ABC transporter [Afifella marina]MBK5917682.1 ABC transporter [Afifella marina]RAI23605.1 ABC transporter [Afifella marina DSM 2698]SCZ21143.1 osmoprotectant transport system permease protein [Afifella marina DSM 2698]